jgi:hypothetical protein
LQELEQFSIQFIKFHSVFLPDLVRKYS